MNILILFDYPYIHGGVNRVLTLGNELTKRGHKIDLVGVSFDRELPFWRYTVKEEKAGDLTVTKFSANRLLPFLLFQLVFMLGRLRKNRVDILQSYNTTNITCITPILLKYFAGFKWTIMYEDINPMMHGSSVVHVKYLEMLEKISCRLTDKIAVLTKFQKEYLTGRGIRKDKIIQIPNFVDVDHISSLVEKKDLKSEYGLENKTVLGYVGSLAHYMGLDDMINVLPHLKDGDIRLLVVGTGNVLEHLKNLAVEREAEDLVIFTGRVPPGEVGSYYSTIDILLLPLENRPANLALDHMKLYEYLATGKPIVAADVGSVGEVIEDGRNGLLYESGNIKQLAEKIVQAALNRKSAGELGASGRQKAGDHDIKKIADRWEKMLSEVLN